MIFNNSIFEYLTYTYYTRTWLHYSICHSFEIETLIGSNWPKQKQDFLLIFWKIIPIYILSYCYDLSFCFLSFLHQSWRSFTNQSQLSLLLLLSVSPWLQDSSLISTYCSYEAKLKVLENLVHAFFCEAKLQRSQKYCLQLWTLVCTQKKYNLEEIKNKLRI